jgi:predicted hydrocarbon binding protein
MKAGATAAALHERLQFDTARGAVLDEQRRYLLLRADVLMGLFDALPAPQREAALQAFGRSVATHGSDSVRAYAAMPGVDDERLLRTMESAAASLGWGRWQLIRNAAGLRLQVDDSPFVAGAATRGAPLCHAIAGMLQGLAQALRLGDVVARETHCAAEHGGATCRFVARPRADFTVNEQMETTR